MTEKQKKVSFHFEKEIDLDNQTKTAMWIIWAAKTEGRFLEKISYVFCDDDYLHSINQKFLNHDTLTDVITFDYSSGEEIMGEVFISVDRVIENSTDFGVEFYEELGRVMIHGLLHLCGYRDKKESDKKLMRTKENYYLSLRG